MKFDNIEIFKYSTDGRSVNGSLYPTEEITDKYEKVINTVKQEIINGKVIFGFIENTPVNIKTIAFILSSIEYSEEKIVISIDTTDTEEGKILSKLLKTANYNNFSFNTVPDINNSNVNSINFIKIGFKNKL